MRTLISIGIALAMLSIMIPGVNAGETKTAGYDVPSGPNGNRGTAISTRLCAEEWDNWDGGLLGDSLEETLFGDNESNPDDNVIGPAMTTGFTTACSTVRTAWADDGFKLGVYSRAVAADCGDCYTEFVVSVADDNFDATYFTFCVITDYSDGGDDSTCGNDTRTTDDGEVIEDDTEDFRASGCSQATVTSNVGAGVENRLATFVYATYVDPDTFDLCFGSSGELTIVMS